MLVAFSRHSHSIMHATILGWQDTGSWNTHLINQLLCWPRHLLYLIINEYALCIFQNSINPKQLNQVKTTNSRNFLETPETHSQKKNCFSLLSLVCNFFSQKFILFVVVHLHNIVMCDANIDIFSGFWLFHRLGFVQNLRYIFLTLSFCGSYLVENLCEHSRFMLLTTH